MNIVLRELLNLYVFTWVQALTFVRRMREAIRQTAIEDVKLNALLDDLEHKARHTKEVEAQHRNLPPKANLIDPMRYLSRVIIQIRSGLESTLKLLSSSDPLFIEASHFHQLFFVKGSVSLIKGSADERLSLSSLLLKSMQDDHARWASLSLDRFQPILSGAHDRMLQALSSHSSELQGVNFKVVHDARVVHQNALCCVVAHIVSVYFSHSEESEVFKSLSGVVLSMKQSAGSSPRRAQPGRELSPSSGDVPPA